jgi:hypothetical protein
MIGGKGWQVLRLNTESAVDVIAGSVYVTAGPDQLMFWSKGTEMLF